MSSASEWTEIRLIGSEKAVEGAVRILRECGAEIGVDSGTQKARKGGDGKVRRHLTARLADEPGSGNTMGQAGCA
ncbi:hypothetical protein ACQEUU_37065 [Nonomuraea sp. CA-218870]|uniref:hypothetical protein n=1 Tax=Nonomuraea sp. CA-218870 TaxID=3239998 RepID=UPI003D8FA526